MARTQTLPRLQAALRRSMDHQLIGKFAQFKKEIDRIWANGNNPLRPAHLGLDMLAYHFTKTDGPPLYFNYCEDGQKELFSQLMEALMNTNEEEDGGRLANNNNEEIMVARTSEGQLILRVSFKYY